MARGDVVLNPQNLKIVAITSDEPSPWADSYGNDNLQYDVQVMDENGELHDAEWSKRANADAPEINEVVYAQLEEGGSPDYPPKLKTKQQGGKPSGGQRKSSGNKSSGQRKSGKSFDADDPYWKSQNAMKGRSAAQERAVGYVQARVMAAGTGAELIDEKGLSALEKQLTLDGMRDLIEWFAADVEEAGKRGSPTGGGSRGTGPAKNTVSPPAADMTPPPSSKPQTEVPADTEGLGDPGPDAAPPGDDDIPF